MKVETNNTEITVSLTMSSEEANLFFSLFECAKFETAARKAGFDPYPITSSNHGVTLDSRCKWNEALDYRR